MLLDWHNNLDDSARKQQQALLARMQHLKSAEVRSHCRGSVSDRDSRYVAIAMRCPAAQSAMPKDAREPCGRFTINGVLQMEV